MLLRGFGFAAASGALICGHVMAAPEAPINVTEAFSGYPTSPSSPTVNAARSETVGSAWISGGSIMS